MSSRRSKPVKAASTMSEADMTISLSKCSSGRPPVCQNACVLSQLRFDTRKRRVVAEVRIDDFDASARLVRDALGEGNQPVAISRDQNQIVAAMCQPVRVESASRKTGSTLSMVRYGRPPA